MLKILASWKKYLPKKTLWAAGSRERLRRLLKGRGLYLVLLVLLLGGSYYLVTNNAVFNNSGIRTYSFPDSGGVQKQPLPEEPLAGAATVPPDLQEQTGAQAAPATSPVSGQPGEGDSLPSLTLPLKGQVSARYGFTYMPAFGDYRFHPGVDFEAPAGSEVKAAAAGIVKQVEYSEDWRYRLIIDTGSGYQTVYAHLSNIKVAKGDKIQTGTTLGLLGEPGTAEAGTPPHLHLELSKNGKPIDPTPALQ